MESHLGTNWIPLLVLLPVTLIAAIGIGWLIARLKVEKWKKMTLGIAGLFAIFCFSVLITTFSSPISPSFADTFKFYAYSSLAPAGDPFKDNENSQPVIMMAEVQVNDGTVNLLRHPNPDYPSIVTLFPPGRFIGADLMGDIFTIPDTEPGGLPRAINTSLWWALTTNIESIVSSSK